MSRRRSSGDGRIVLSCQEVVEELGNYLDEEGAPALRRQLEAHLRNCLTCSVLFDSLHHILKVVSQSGAFELPPGLSDRIVARIQASQNPKKFLS